MPTEDTIWAKAHRVPDGPPAVLSLVDHSADVAACLVAILEIPTVRARMARLAGGAELDDVQIARLGYLAALHDFGKANHGFQQKIRWQNGVEGARPLSAGHVREAIGVLAAYDLAGMDAVYDALFGEEDGPSWFPDPVESWQDQYWGATICHHGRPYSMQTKERFQGLWKPRAGRDPLAGILELAAAAAARFPDAFEPSEPLPASREFVHAYAGWLNLADWIGSDEERFFPFDGHTAAGYAAGDRFAWSKQQARGALTAIGFANGARRDRISVPPPIETFLPSGAAPRPAQAVMANLPIPAEGAVTVLESATGSGKTEAVLHYFARAFQAGAVEGLYFALPTRAAATQLYERTRRAMDDLFGDDPPPVVLAVPGYLRVDGRDGERVRRAERDDGETASVSTGRLPPARVLYPDDATQERGWATESSKRYLAAGIAVGTIDQVLLSTLAVKHSHLRAAPLLRQLLVVDEVHASDPYMTRLLGAALDRHRAAGGHALLLSATLGVRQRHELLGTGETPSLSETLAEPYPLIVQRPNGGRTASYPMQVGSEEDSGKAITATLSPTADDPTSIAGRALAAARRGARVLVLRNTVTACRETQEALVATAGSDQHLLFSCRGIPAPHHARFAAQDRQRLDQAIEQAFGREAAPGGRVAVTTQTVEQSLDIDADWMLTDLCPMDVLLQRLGRLHRHERVRPAGFERARVEVLVPVERDLAGMIHPSGRASGSNGFGTVYSDLRAFETTWRQLERTPEFEVPRDNRELVERTLHPEALVAVVETGSKWENHVKQELGEQIAALLTARDGLLDWSREERAFGSFELQVDRKLSSRLGESDLLAHFDPPVPGPFGEPVADFTIPMRYIDGDLDAEAKPVPRTTSTNPLRFTFAGTSFEATALGLRRLDPTRTNQETP